MPAATPGPAVERTIALPTVLERNPNSPQAMRKLIAPHGRMGRTEDAKRTMFEYEALGQTAAVSPECPTGPPYQCPVFSMLAQVSFGSSRSPACKSSIETLSGERTKAICPSRGGRLIVTPAACSFSHIS